MKMRMPNFNQLEGGSYFCWKDGSVNKFCAIGWIEHQKNSEFSSGSANDFHASLEGIFTIDATVAFDALMRSEKTEEALALIAETMVGLGHTPVYDANCTEPYWKVPEEPEQDRAAPTLLLEHDESVPEDAIAYETSVP